VSARPASSAPGAAAIGTAAAAPEQRKPLIHPTAIVHPRADLGAGVSVGPWAIIGERCVVGDGCDIGARAVLERNVTLAPRVRIGIGSIIGGDPQDLKYAGEDTDVTIGEETVVREYATINRGTAESGRTSVGRACYIMSYVHLAHDCHVGDHVILSNGAQFAGHVTVEDRVGVSGLCVIHQFTRLGRHAYVGGGSKVVQDVPPFVIATGQPTKLYGLNAVGLRRNGFSDETVRELKHAYRLLFRSDLKLAEAVARVEAEVAPIPEVQHLLRFVESSPRGVGV
jgi:UDP-N-acetylglucosamine acyltransferase